MSEHSLEKNINANLYSDTSIPTYFGYQEGYLDLKTLRYRAFGAIWKQLGRKRFILGYWFADDESEINSSVKKAGWNNLINANNQIKEIYKCIRSEQEKENWQKRRRLPFHSMFKKPWKGWKEGWFIIRSNNHFPCILSCIQKKQFSVWVVHVHVCEKEYDIKKFLNLINAEHNINLKSGEIQAYNKLKVISYS